MKNTRTIAIIGGGPCGLMAAELLAKQGYEVTVYDRMPGVGRKFLMAGRGGLNLTHSEPLPGFMSRYGEASKWLSPHIHAFPPEFLKEWCEGLGQKIFTGSSGRIFPETMKAAPLLRAWLERLRGMGVRIAANHNWQGWEGESLVFATPEDKKLLVKADATLLALGGASWPKLGSNGAWSSLLEEHGVEINPLRPANCGFVACWSEYFRARFAGHPLKPVRLTHQGVCVQGEIMLTREGVEGGAIYKLGAALREAISSCGSARLELDLHPHLSIDALTRKLDMPRAGKSFSTWLRKAGLSPLAIALLREILPSEEYVRLTPAALAKHYKALPLRLTATTTIDRAISTAGGITAKSLDKNFMLRVRPGVFAAGEMLDWEAPTGGYLLQACFSTAVAAANGIVDFLETTR